RDVNAIFLPLLVFLAYPALQLGYVAGVIQGIAEQERLPLLPFVGTVELPSADEGVENVVHVIPKLPSSTKGQLVNGRQRVTVRPLGGRDAVFQLRVGGVEVTHLLPQPRPGVRPGESEALRETLLRLKL